MAQDKSNVKYAAGSIIQMQGEKPKDSIYIVQQGTIRTEWILEKRIEDTGPGSMVGLISAFTELPPMETVTALSPVQGILVKKAHFEAFFKSNPTIVKKIFQTLAQQRHNLEYTLANAILRVDTDKASPQLPTSTENLYKLGSIYEKFGNNHTAYLAYKRYLYYHPGGADARAAEDRRDALAINAVEQPEYGPADVYRKYPKYSVVFFEGEPGNEFYLIRSGLVRAAKIVDDKRAMIGMARTGNIFGEAVLFADQPRNYTVIAHEDLEVLTITEDGLMNMLSTTPKMISHLMYCLAGRVWYASHRLQKLAEKEPGNRVLGFLALTLETEHLSLNFDGGHTFYFGSKELVEMAGLSDEEGKAVMDPVLASGVLVEQEDGKLFCPKVPSLSRAFVLK
ncbi:MAG: cyclic nucleotide-binding domain-containing protein [Spirochaetaceae bacterium]|jgi:CRP/FNR family transcriptional regulator|nr:cyclic nucleotide-binding domain-containing protein [Spirochaetaceae bacterium]